VKLLWSPRANQDLNRITDLIAKDKPTAALQWAKEVHQKVFRLGSFPKSGRIVPEFGRNEIREILIGDYRVIYKIEKEVAILTIFHGAKHLIEI
jgi:toxin ParE1/3/4